MMECRIDHPITKKIRESMWAELDTMAACLDMPLSGSPYREIRTVVNRDLALIALHLNRGEIDPNVEIRLCERDLPKKPAPVPLRIGFYPVAANPFHWGHLIIGLRAIARFNLDKVIYVIAGSDPRKPGLLPAGIRHTMGKEVLAIFAPLFGYSSIALGNMADGETNTFKILQLNLHQEMAAFYIGGGDHYHRINPKTKGPDTIQKLEDKFANRAYDYRSRVHTVSAIFAERETKPLRFDTALDVYFLRTLPFVASSTQIREAFQGECAREKLAILPHTAYRFATTFGLYHTNVPLATTPIRKGYGLGVVYPQASPCCLMQ